MTSALMTKATRLIATLFFILVFFEGVTLGHVGLGLINCAVFALLALIVIRNVPKRWGTNGVVYGMGGAFFVSLLTPFVLLFASGGNAP